jgi:Arc/MetJ-type ribon-helix-helix transcriptional regulator
MKPRKVALSVTLDQEIVQKAEKLIKQKKYKKMSNVVNEAIKKL